ncbi:MAG: M6 family metalloprotease domain-containing protein [Spirochaetes bacterium]|nr:M6 family metalloprotease domain-containing protein [Spirochaetota bacterium]
MPPPLLDPREGVDPADPSAAIAQARRRQPKPLPTPTEMARQQLWKIGPKKVAPYGTFDEKMLPVSNLLNLIVVPVEYGDTNLSITSNELVQLFQGPAYSTVSNYYAIQSMGKLALTAWVTDKVHLPNPRVTYNDSNVCVSFLQNVGTNLMAQFSGWSAAQLSNTFDANGDGFVDAILFIHAGEGGESTSSSERGTNIWSHQWSFYFHATGGYTGTLGTAAAGYKLGPLFFGRYLIVAEILNRKATNVFQRSTIGTISHEFGHILGLSDLYNTGSAADPEPYFLYDGELMTGGSYNAAPTNVESYLYGPGTNLTVSGKYPAPLSSYHKKMLGWLSPAELYRVPVTNVPVSNHSATGAPTTGRSFRARSVSEGEYWLVENRYFDPAAAFSFDAGLGGRGLLLWRVQEDVIGPPDSHYFCDNGMNNNPKRRGLRLEVMQPKPYSNTWANTQYAFWTNSVRGFGISTTPSSTYEGTGKTSGVTVSNISAAGPVMTFAFRSIDFDAMAGATFTSFPSPFSVTGTPVTLVVTLPTAGLKALWVVTDDGRLVKDLSTEALASARGVAEKTQYACSWNGVDVHGKTANPGMLFVRLQTEAGTSTAGRFYVRP